MRIDQVLSACWKKNPVGRGRSSEREEEKKGLSQMDAAPLEKKDPPPKRT